MRSNDDGERAHRSWPHHAPGAEHLLDTLEEGVLVLDAAGTVLEANTVAAALLGTDARPLAGRPDPLAAEPVLHSDGTSWPGFRLTELAPSPAAAAPVRRRVVGLVRGDHRVSWLAIAVAHAAPGPHGPSPANGPEPPVPAQGGDPVETPARWIVSVVEVPAPVPAPIGDQAPAVLGTPPADEDTELGLAFDASPIGMVLVEVDERGHGRVARINAVLRSRVSALGAEADSVPVRDWIHPDDRPLHVERYRLLCAGRIAETSYQIRFRGPDGTQRRGWMRAVARTGGGRVTHLVYYVVDVTDRVESERRLERLALTDPITGLANRLRFEQLASAALGRAAAGDGTVGMMLLDLDRFKVVNDSLGHAAGDAILIEAGLRLQRALPAGTVVARVGGDEFAAVLENLSGCAQLLDLSFQVLDAMSPPYELPNGDTVGCTASIGLTVTRDGAVPVGDLVREADLALYQAKDTGRDRCAIFDGTLRQRADARIEQEHRLRAALSTDGVRMYLQPVVDLVSGAPAGAEALARLVHPVLGLIEPEGFIDVAEDTGLIAEIDARIAELAVERLAVTPWDELPRIAVNVSTRSLASSDYLRRVTEALERHGVPGQRLHAEVTERGLLDGAGAAANGLAGLTRLGVPVGIDDFGTGYSALAYLGRFPLDFLKVDRSFVAELGRNERAHAVVGAIVALAHAHDLAVTAEGVETAEQAAALVAIGCDSAQGWHFGHPVDWSRSRGSRVR